MVGLGKTVTATDTVSGTAAPASLTRTPCTTPTTTDELTPKRKCERYTSDHMNTQEQDQYMMATESLDGCVTPSQNSVDDGFMSAACRRCTVPRR